MNSTSKLQQQAREQTAQQQAAQGQSAAEFATVEDLLRHDAAGTAVPPAVGERVRRSVEQEPPRPSRPWWRRWFGG
jgi:hypothetical protein